MKSFTFFESAILGFLVGVVASTYTLFVIYTERSLGLILNWLTLRPLIELIVPTGGWSLIVEFLLIVALFVIYGAILGLLIKKNNKLAFIIVPLIVLLVVGIFFEQKNESVKEVEESVLSSVNYAQSVSLASSTPKTPAQYFGNEVVGDLNFDGKADVAFVLFQNDLVGRLGPYYLATALATSSSGHIGTNLLLLSEKIKLNKISIDNGVISVDYRDRLDGTNKIVYAKVVNGKLEPVETNDKVKGKDILIP